MAVSISGDGAVTGVASVETPTTLSGLTIPTTGFGKVLQVVRSTDGSARSTTSTSYVDVTGMSVTISPVSASSNIIVITSCLVDPRSAQDRVVVGISDSADNLLSGAERGQISLAGTMTTLTVIGWHAPGTTTATTYKTKFLVADGGTATIRNNLNTGQMYAIEVGP